MTPATAQGDTTPTAGPPYAAALSISGPSWRSRLAHGNQVPLIHPEVHLGLLAANDIVLSDTGASRLHAVIRWTPQGYVLQDLGSTNGTFVDGQRITAPTALVPGQHVRIGNTDLLFQQVQVHDGHAPASSPPSGAMPGGMAAPGMTAMPAQTIAAIAARAQQTASFNAWLAAQKDKHYWRVFLGILVAYVVVLQLIGAGGGLNPHVIPLVMILSSMLVPVTFVVFCWDEGAVQDMSVATLGLAFLGGGVLSIVFVTVLNLLFGSLGSAPIFIGVIEETGKAAAALWFLRNRRLRSELDGLVLGAAIGMGFAMIETAGYGFDAFTHGAVGFLTGTNGAVTFGDVYQHGFDVMVQELNLRMLLALFGHGVWTAIICTTIWRERGRPLGDTAPSLLLAWGIAVCLHALYDALASSIDSVIPQIVIGIAGLFILRFFIQEAVERAKLGPGAPPPPPLYRALQNYVEHPLSRLMPRPVAQAGAFAAAPGFTVPTAGRPAPGSSVPMGGEADSSMGAGVAAQGPATTTPPARAPLGEEGDPE